MLASMKKKKTLASVVCVCFQKFQEGDLVIVRETFSYTDIYNHRRNVLDVNTILKIVYLRPKSGGMSDLVDWIADSRSAPLWWVTYSERVRNRTTDI